MSRWPLLLETIKLKDGRLCNLEFHQERMLKSARKLWGRPGRFDLQKLIHIPKEYQTGLFKLRVIYNNQEFRQEIVPYVSRKISTVKLVYTDEINYDLKYADRKALNQLKDQNPDYDEILIVKNGLITDTSYTNIAFFDGSNWVTPAQPLLCGTQRAKLLSEGRLVEEDIHPKELKSYQSFRLFNALMEFDVVETHDIDGIIE